MTDTSTTQEAHAQGAAVSARLRRSRRGWRIVAFVALAIAALAALARFTSGGPADADHIARVAIDGAIMTDRVRLQTLEALMEDETVRAVILDINSPGGSTAGGEELYEAIAALRATKPVVAIIDELGASAAYMTAIAADRIYARRLSIVGSIGVLYQHYDAGQLLRTIGIDIDKIASGDLKAEPDFDEPMSDAVRESLTALVMDSFEWFVDIVAERRAMDRQAVLAVADGRIMTGRQGIEAGLIDAVGGEAEAIAWLETERDVSADLEVLTWFPRPEPGFGGWLQYLGGEARAAVGLPATGPIVLDGLVSLWQVDQALGSGTL